jgi:rhodanese-related sulfurtransferase
MAQTFKTLVDDLLPEVKELFPWDLEEVLEDGSPVLLVDIREQEEFDAAYIKDSILAQRGILESCCDWNYAETIPELVRARDKRVIVICRSGNRSVLAAKTMQLMGYQDVSSLKTGIKGWNDSDYPLLNKAGEKVDPDWAEAFLNPPVSDEQLEPE